MKTADQVIQTIDEVICNNIVSSNKDARGLLAQNILAQLRNLLDHVSLKIYGTSKGQDLLDSYENLKEGIKYVKSKNGKYKFISDFFKFLQISVSHYTVDPENSERLMLKYYEYLLKLRQFMKTVYNMEILSNLEKFPINQDPRLQEYYEKIAEQIENAPYTINNTDNERYYIQNVKPFFVSQRVYYEVTFTKAVDNTSKFDRHIAFSKSEITPNYAVKLGLRTSCIEILGKEMDIMIIDSWQISIRPCEFRNLAKIFGENIKFNSNSNELAKLMSFMTTRQISLTDVIDLDDENFNLCKSMISTHSKKLHFWPILESCRVISLNKRPGYNVIRYLLYKMNNKILKAQYIYPGNKRLTDLFFQNGCIPFDDMPFNSSLIGHNPKIGDLLMCIDNKDREHELLAHRIKYNTETNGLMYTELDELGMNDIPTLVKKYNNKLYFGHRPRRDIQIYKNHLYINEYEDDCLNILRQLKLYSATGVDNYTNSVDLWLKNASYAIDCDEKRNILKGLFATSHVALIYGAAGTGKSTLINHISNFWGEKKKIYLANTNPAVDNMRRKVSASNALFKTIHQFIHNLTDQERLCDILFVDECSTVSNSDMIQLLNKVNTKLIVLVGDIYQIESIKFGNWFYLAKDFLSPSSVFELTKPYRTSNETLLTLWGKVRRLDDDLIEHLATNSFSETFNDSIFSPYDKDEIVLCLNYDGLYGINNLNRFLQGGNPEDSVLWGIETYKVNDPILFNESNRFAPVIYNNLKGRITNISKTEETITFDIEVYGASINGVDAADSGFELIGNSNSGNAIIRFTTNRLKSTDDDENSMDTVIPFQVAYAVSIHKAQGLEYNSVKIVISNEVEERITHNILYTAITRAKEHLKIYWTPETEKNVLSNIKSRFNNKDWNLIKSHYPDLR